MTSVSNKNSYADSLLKENQANVNKSYTDFNGPIKPYPNASYKEPFQYYDSVVTNSHQFPRMEYIRPFTVEDVRSDDRVLESIEARKRFAIGPYVLTNRQINFWN
jgi:hypothetical protein